MKKSPMKMRTAKSDAKPKQDKKGGRKLSAMERYAQERNRSIALGNETGMMQHDPQTDVYHLQKAAEVNGDESRKRAARAHAAKTIKKMQQIMK
jgi:hypothetical protein